MSNRYSVPSPQAIGRNAYHDRLDPALPRCPALGGASETIRATLLPGAELVPGRDKGVYNTYRSYIRTNNGDTVAFVKNLPIMPMLSELISSTVGRATDNALPQPYLVSVDPGDLRFNNCPMARDGNRRLAFASAAIVPEYGTLYIVKARLVPVRYILDWDGFIPAVYYDEMINNSDRHNNNIYYLGGTRFALFDNSHGFGHEFCAAKLSQMEATNNNQLIQDWMKNHITRDMAERIVRERGSFLNLYGALDYTSIVDKSGISEIVDDDLCEIYVKCMSNRWERVPGWIAAKLGIPLLRL